MASLRMQRICPHNSLFGNIPLQGITLKLMVVND